MILSILFADGFEIKNIADPDDGCCPFPILTSKQPVAKSINRYLQKEILFQEIKNPSKYLDKAYKEFIVPDSYKIYTNDNKIFSLAFTLLANGNEYNSVYYTFDVSSAKKIDAKMLFTKKGYEVVSAKYSKYEETKYKKRIEEFKNQDEDDSPYILEGLIECKIDSHNQKILDFYIENSNIIVPVGNCLANSSEWDIEGNYIIKPPKIKEYLSDYAREILLINQTK